MYFYSNNGVFREPIQVTTYESITGHSTILPIVWVEIHPLFDGQEFDLAILGLKSYIQRKLLILRLKLNNLKILENRYFYLGIYSCIQFVCQIGRGWILKANTQSIDYIDIRIGKNIKFCIR